MRHPLSLAAGAILAAASFVFSAQAHDVVLDPDAKPQGATSRTTIVQAGGVLYNLSTKLDGTLLLLASSDSGQTWKDTGFVFNDNSSGIGATNPTNYCCLATDSRGWLHATWRRAYYPSFYSQYYRNVDPTSFTQSSNIIDVQNNVVKVSATTRSVAMGLAIDSKGYVWMLATHSSWMSQLLRSDVPYAAGAAPTFTSVGALSPTGSASQNAAVAVDANDVVHCMFHFASGTRSIAHNAYDPATQTWSGTVRLATPANNNAMLATDRLGNVHTLYGVGSGPYSIEYQRWDKTGGWGAPVPVANFTAAQLGTSNSQWVFTIAAHAIDGTAFAIYRDFENGGALVAAKKGLQDAAFAQIATIEPASTAQNVYYLPNVRGSLHPFPSNATLCHLDLLYMDRSGAKAPLIYHRLNTCSASTFGTACAGTSGPPVLRFSELARLGRPMAIELENARANSAAAFFLGASKTLWSGVPLPLDLTGLGAPGCSLFVSVDTVAPLPTDGQGAATVGFTVPMQPAIVGAKLFTQFLVIDAGANAANLVFTNGGEFSIEP